MIEYEVNGNRVTARLQNCYLNATKFVMSEIVKAINGKDNDFLRAIPVDVLRAWILAYCRENMADTYTASAVCSEKDVFFVDVGARIARTRLLQKYYKALNRVYEQMRYSIYDFGEAVSEMNDRARDRAHVWERQEKTEIDPDYFTKVHSKHKTYYGNHGRYDYSCPF